MLGKRRSDNIHRVLQEDAEKISLRIAGDLFAQLDSFSNLTN